MIGGRLKTGAGLNRSKKVNFKTVKKTGRFRVSRPCLLGYSACVPLPLSDLFHRRKCFRPGEQKVDGQNGDQEETIGGPAVNQHVVGEDEVTADGKQDHHQKQQSFGQRKDELLFP